MALAPTPLSAAIQPAPMPMKIAARCQVQGLVGAVSEAALEEVPMEVVPVQKVPSPAKIQPSPKTEVDHVAEMKIRFCNGDRPPL